MFRVTQNLLSNNSFVLVPPDTHNIVKAAELLHQGALVAFPTETVYGLGAAAENDNAVAEIYRTKGRPSHNPLIVHVADMAMAERYGVFNGMARTLAEAFFPAALTLVVPVRTNSVARTVLAGGNTVALRCPAHVVAQSLLRAFDAGIAAPSANRSGRVSPTNAIHVVKEFADVAGALRMILDGGACAIGLESTVVDCSGVTPRILRAGSITEAKIADILSLYPIDMSHSQTTNIALKSPGLLASHYAPNAKVRLHATHVNKGEALLAFSAPIADYGEYMLNLSLSGDVNEAAFHLYSYLRALDEHGVQSIAVMPIPNIGVGIAINDRLQRAAAERTDAS